MTGNLTLINFLHPLGKYLGGIGFHGPTGRGGHSLLPLRMRRKGLQLFPEILGLPLLPAIPPPPPEAVAARAAPEPPPHQDTPPTRGAPRDARGGPVEARQADRQPRPRTPHRPPLPTPPNTACSPARP